MRKLLLILLIVLITGCSQNQKLIKSKAYKGIYDEKTSSILILPPINKTTNVEAKETFYSSLVVPITQKGYYVFPSLLTLDILKEESAYDAEMFIDNSMKNVGDLFGCDAVLFTIIHDWTKSTLASYITVKIEYILKSTKTDEVLFHRIGKITYAPQNNSSGGLAGALSNMISTALTKEIEIGRACNNYTFKDLPEGKNSPKFNSDMDLFAAPKEFSVRLNK
jgi:hypothetical protein